MNDFQIVYNALRALTSGTNIGDEKTLNIDLETFTESLYDSIEKSEMYDGTTQESEEYIYSRYQCVTENFTGDDLLNIREFLYSVLGGHDFTMTNADEGDRIMPCKLIGRFSPLREGRLIANFRFSFTVQDFTVI